MKLTQTQKKFLEAHPKRLSDEFWKRGNLRHLLWPGQRQVYDWTKQWKEENVDFAGPIVWELHRAAGKTFMLCVLALERCLSKPYQDVKYGAPNFQQADDIVTPVLVKHILHHELYGKPSDISIEKKEGRKWIVKNPMWWQMDADLDRDACSSFELIGCTEQANRHRGKRSDMVLLDECRDIGKDNMDNMYIIDDVFGPHFSKRENPLMILSSTPPDSMNHPFIKKYYEEGQLEGRYFRLVGADNPDWTEKDDATQRKLLIRGTNTSKYDREIQCAHISETSRLAVEEFTEVLQVKEDGTYVRRCDNLVVPWPRPSTFFPFSCADLGFVDFTAVLYAYFDFEAQKLIVEREYVVHNKSTGEIVDKAMEIEKELYEGTFNYSQMRRWTDNDPQLIADFRKAGWLVQAVDKTKVKGKKWKWAALASLKTAIANEEIIIDPSCKNLIEQLTNGQLNQSRGDYEREIVEEINPDEPVIGHCDALVALCYLWWMVQPYRMLRPSVDKTNVSDYIRGMVSRNTPRKQRMIGRNKTNVQTSGPIQVTNNPLNITRKPPHA